MARFLNPIPMTLSYTIRKFTASDLELAYSHSIPAAPAASLAFFHGVLRTGDIFSPLTSHLHARYELRQLDQRGHGASSRAERYLVVDFVADAVAWLREEIRHPVVLYGHSLGAMVAAAAAAQCPELVRACVLEDPPFRTLGAHIGASNFHDYFAQIQQAIAAPGTTRELAVRLGEITFHDPATAGLRRMREVRDGVSLRLLASSLRRLDPHVLEPLVGGRWLDGYDEERTFAAIRCPVLLLQADLTQGGMLIDDDVALFRRLVDDVTLIRMPGVGHMMHWHRTQEIANLVTGFVDSLDPAE